VTPSGKAPEEKREEKRGSKRRGDLKEGSTPSSLKDIAKKSQAAAKARDQMRVKVSGIVPKGGLAPATLASFLNPGTSALPAVLVDPVMPESSEVTSDVIAPYAPSGESYTYAPTIAVIVKDHRTGRKEVSHEYAKALLSSSEKSAKVAQWAKRVDGPSDLLHGIMLRVMWLFVTFIESECDRDAVPETVKTNVTIDVFSIAVNVLVFAGSPAGHFTFTIPQVSEGVMDQIISQHFRYSLKHLSTNFRGLAYTDMVRPQTLLSGDEQRGYELGVSLIVPTSSYGTIVRLSSDDSSNLHVPFDFTLKGILRSTAFKSKVPVRVTIRVVGQGCSNNGRHVLGLDFDSTACISGVRVSDLLALSLTCCTPGDDHVLPFFIEAGPLTYGRLTIHVWRGSPSPVRFRPMVSFPPLDSDLLHCSMFDVSNCLAAMNDTLLWLLVSMASQADRPSARETVRVEVQKGLGSQFTFDIGEKLYSISKLSLSLLLESMSMDPAGRALMYPVETNLRIIGRSNHSDGFSIFLHEYLLSHSVLSIEYEGKTEVGYGAALAGMSSIMTNLTMMLSLIEMYDTMVEGLTQLDPEELNLAKSIVDLIVKGVPIDERRGRLFKIGMDLGNARLTYLHDNAHDYNEMYQFTRCFTKCIQKHSPS